MEFAEEEVSALSWAFGVPPEEGVPVLRAIAQKLSSVDGVPLCNLAHAAVCPATVPDVDARELMSALVSTNASFASPDQLALYVVVTSRVYAVLYLQTVARQVRVQKARLSPTRKDGINGEMAAACAAAATTMRAWSRDVASVLIHAVLPQLCLQDAQPRTLTTTQQLTTRGVPPPFADEKAAQSSSEPAFNGKAEGETQQEGERLVQAHRHYRVAGALTRLVEVVHHATGDAAVCPLLLAVYATLHNMEAFPVAAAPLASAANYSSSPTTAAATSVLQHWRCRFLREVEKRPQCTTAAPPCETLSQDESTTLEQCRQTLRRLLDAVVGSQQHAETPDVWCFAVTHLIGGGFPHTSEATLFSAEIERATAPPESTAAQLARERAEEVEACTLVVTDDVDEAPASGESGDASSHLSRQGALLLLGDALRDTAVCRNPIFTVSATTLLLSVAGVYASVLTCPSCAALMRHLLFLHDVLAAVPKYSVEFAEGSGGGVPSTTAAGFDACLTRRYEAFFELLKALLGVSALCPSDEHRRVARVITVELLERLEEEPRVRMRLSLLSLCPYPSIARFFLDRLLEDWRAQTPDTRGEDAASTAPLACMVPLGLAECMTTFLQHLVTGTRGFLDPLIAALNFVRVEASRRAWILRALGQPHVKAHPKTERDASYAWRHLIGVVRQRVLPQCDELINPPETAAASPFALPPLSPLDAFSLSCAVDGVKGVLAVPAAA